ncbi:FtsX-like permease family protein [Leptobacterium flavescens]|uniref:FtsX-like permease family protein n=1 Tax=Leptobacterium flavescens TaxID=472055 RepID=A0A6P0UVY8_9FLAO|nr:FtsX-like permease family protein [Leptobacterium flavescens]NER14953.1 FtsX-like permease family protein [Leptobacterium flavescens]
MNIKSIKTNLFIGLQYLTARKKQSLLAMLGVLFGVTTFIVMVNFMTGVNDFLDAAVFEGSPDITISPQPDLNKVMDDLDLDLMLNPLYDLDKIEDILEASPNVRAYSKQVITPAIFISQHVQLPGAINGIEADEEKKLYDLDKRILSGRGFESFSEEGNIVLGTSLAKKLMVKTGDSLRIIIPNGNEKQFRVSGIFSFGITTIDNVRTYAPAETLRSLLEQEELITNLHVKLRDRNNIEIKETLLNRVSKIGVEDWKDNNRTIVAGNKVRDVLTWSVSFALLLVAGFGIYNIMNITVVQKRKDIAVLKTIGYKNTDIVFIFLVQSLIIGIIGALLGAAFGYAISYLISVTPLQAKDFIIVDTYPVNFKGIYYILGIFFGILTTVFAGYFPSRKASKTDPVNIIRDI